MHGICKLLRRWQTFLTCVEDFDFFSLKHCTKGQYLSFYSKLALDWNRMRRLNYILWRLQQTWEADRKTWGRQRDEASTSRLMGNWWFVVFTKPVWVWLTRTRTGSRQKTSRLTGLFSFLTLFFFLPGIWICFEWSCAIPHLFTCRISSVPRGFIIASVPRFPP